MTLSIQEYIDRASEVTVEELREIPQDELRALAENVQALREQVQKEKQILFYKPVSEAAKAIHLSMAKEVVVIGGNRSSKTDTILADTVICMTGIIPESLKGIYPQKKVQCPMRIRYMCESLTNTWDAVIKPKLQWNRWNGRGEPGGPFGHWGWIPRDFLLKGRWEDSWSEKNRTLTLLCGCTFSVMSYDQDIEDLFGGSFHRVVNDEGSPSDMYRENKMRTMDTGGQIFTGMTPPDDEATAWRAAWIHDDLYEKGLPGPGKDPDIDSFTLFTEDNRILDKESIQLIAKGLTPAQREVRLRGAFIHLGGRIYPLYTDKPRTWCFQCSDVVIEKDRTCGNCGSRNVREFCHFVEPFDQAFKWPALFLLDPHPRKPNAMSWVSVDPNDDLWQVAELEVDGAPEDVKKKVVELEADYKMNISARLIDPNMAESPAHSAGRRHVTVRDEFDAAGLRCGLADDHFTVGMKRVREYLKPDPRTKQPRFHIFNSCPKTNRQFLRYVWAEWTRYSADQKDPKAKPRDKEDDFPTLIRYAANADPRYAAMRMGNQPIRAVRERKEEIHARV